MYEPGKYGRSIKEYPTETSAEFWELLLPKDVPSKFSDIFCESPQDLYFRGQSSASLPLTPSLLRPENNPAKIWPSDYKVSPADQYTVEMFPLQAFVAHCDSVGLSIPNDSAEFRRRYALSLLQPTFFKDSAQWPDPALLGLMALAQHHGLPTRLLDWSRRSFVAAYFAAAGALRSNKPVGDDEPRLAVWVLNARMARAFREISLVQVPGSNNANVAAQAGVFTVLRQSVEDGNFKGTPLLDEFLADKPESILAKVSLPSSKAPEVIYLCEAYGVSAATLYPDYYGAARAAMDNFRCWTWEPVSTLFNKNYRETHLTRDRELVEAHLRKTE